MPWPSPPPREVLEAGYRRDEPSGSPVSDRYPRVRESGGSAGSEPSGTGNNAIVWICDRRRRSHLDLALYAR